MGFFPERNGNARKIISRVSEKRSIGFNAFYTFLLVHGYLYDDPTSLEYICKVFPGIFCYILGVKVTDLVSLTLCNFKHFYVALVLKLGRGKTFFLEKGQFDDIRVHVCLSVCLN